MLRLIVAVAVAEAVPAVLMVLVMATGGWRAGARGAAGGDGGRAARAGFTLAARFVVAALHVVVERRCLHDARLLAKGASSSSSSQ